MPFSLEPPLRVDNATRSYRKPAVTVHSISDRKLPFPQHTKPHFSSCSLLQCGFAKFDGNLYFNGRPILYDVPSNVVLTPVDLTCTLPTSTIHSGTFLGFHAAKKESRHVASLGKLKETPFCSLFRFKVWWTTQWVGNCGSDLESETQFLLLDTAGKAVLEGYADYPYVVFLPIVEGRFRASLQAGKEDNVDVCVESGSLAVVESVFRTCVYIHAGSNPFALVKDAMKVVRTHLGTFKLLEEKRLPAFVDKFGWCTWDAFYLNVCPRGVWQGIKEFVDGGLHPRFLLLDDGWQSIAYDYQGPEDDAAMSLTTAGQQMVCRLSSIHENYKFRSYKTCSMCYTSVEENEHVHSNGTPAEGMSGFIRDLKDKFKLLDDIYVWHAITGYWGGVRPRAFGSRLVRPFLSPGLLSTMEDLAVDKLANNTIGLIPPALVGEFFNRLHSYLANCGITGVKVDVIHVLEMLGEDYGGRVELAKAYYDALSMSISKHLGGNGAIASMEQCNDFIYLGTEQMCVGRVGDDFWCEDPQGDPLWTQGLHMVHCAYNSMWMGHVICPDWDMFQSSHISATFHAASRAISGGPIYVSDALGHHDFNLLRMLVFPDGTIPRCSSFALPTLDCLFRDPARDASTVLKVWNLNRCGGVVGAFNCQGGGWCRQSRTTKPFKECRLACIAKVCAKDVDWPKKTHFHLLKESIDEEFVVYVHQANKLLKVNKDEFVHVTLDPLTFELFTFSPIIQVNDIVQFAAIGLINMLNAGGTLLQQRIISQEPISILEDGGDYTIKHNLCVEIEVQSGGQLCAFASRIPKICTLDGKHITFTYQIFDGRLLVDVPWKGGKSSTICLTF